MQFAGGRGFFRFMYPEVTQGTMNEIIRAALDGGINWFDTAEAYGFGRSERGLAGALAAVEVADGDVRIATKWLPLLRTAGSIRRTIADRQRALSPYSVDLHQVHQPISFSSPEDEMNAMADLVESGQIRAVGVSNFNAQRMRRAHQALRRRGLPLASNQVRYSLLHRSIETNGVLDAARQLGVTIIAYSPLDSGLMSGKYHRDPAVLQATPVGRRARFRRRLEETAPLVAALEEIGQAYQATPAQVALNWLVNFHGDAVVAIPGASRPDQAADSAGAMRFSLTDDELAHIDRLTRADR
mgnify:CR=1 FL=1